MRFSVVIPTYQRRDLVARTVAALQHQVHDDFEVIVVIDGSTDGTAEALRGLGVGFHLVVLEQGNKGSAEARNAGVAVATAETLLFLDDDMEAHPSLLAEHERSQREGADLVLGDMPLNPDSPRNLLSWGVGIWANSRRERLTADGAEIRLGDLLTGQMSVSRTVYERVGGFDVTFTRGGQFGGADVDFGYRVLKAGCRIVFNPAAISYQYYDVDPAQFLRRARDAGRARQELIFKYPERAEQFARGPEFFTRRTGWTLGPLVVAPAAFSWPLRALAVALVRTGRRGEFVRKLFFAMRTMEHHRGARQARAASSTGEAKVLAYHSISDLRHDPILGKYAVPEALFAAHLDALTRRGWVFIDLDTLLRALEGRDRLPPRALMLTFDDAYTDLLSAACPLLVERGIPAVVFAIAGQTGGTNVWAREGAQSLDLLDADGLRAVAAHGVEVGSHGSSHRELPRVPADELEEELEGSAEQLEALGLPRPRVYSYPYGEWSPEAAAAVRRAGYRAAFAISPGVVKRGADRHALPRVEILSTDTEAKLRLKLATAGWPRRWRDLLFRLLRVV